MRLKPAPTDKDPPASKAERILVSKLLVEQPRFGSYFDAAVPAMRSRIRSIVQENGPISEELVAMATMLLASDGGSLRTFSGGQTFENGWISSAFMGRLLHFQGMAQRNLVIRLESEFSVASIGTETRTLLFADPAGPGRYTGDVEVKWRDGTITVFEVKRDERDLEDPALRTGLARAAEIFRRCDIGFEIIMRDEIFASRDHRINCELFAARGYTHVAKEHLHKLEAHAMRSNCESTYGALAEALEPHNALYGKALVQALTIRRRVEIDLTTRLTNHTPVRIH